MLTMFGIVPSLIELVFMVLLFTPSFFFNHTATTEIYTLSLHDALPISLSTFSPRFFTPSTSRAGMKSARSTSWATRAATRDRKSTRLNSSHVSISYAVFCLKKKNVNFHTSESVLYPAITPQIHRPLRHS